MKPPQRIALLDHMGLGNLGDAATQDAVIELIRRRLPNAEICLVSLDPADSARRHGLRAFAIASSCDTEEAAPLTSREEQAESRAEPAKSRAEQAKSKEEPSQSQEAMSNAAPGLLRRIKQALQRVGPIDRLIVALWRSKRELAFLLRCRRRLAGVDLLVVSGGGQIDDSWGGGASGAPLNLLRWSLLSKLTGTTVAYLSVGAGPLESRASRARVRLALRLARVRSFRDEGARRFVESIGVRGRLDVHPDLAHALRVEAPPPSAESEGLVIGIGPIPYQSPDWWPDKDAAGYRRYVETLAAFAIRADEKGHRVRFLLGEVYMDASAVDDIRRCIRERAGDAVAARMPQPAIETVGDLVRAIGETDVVVSSRFHGVLLSQRLGRPVIAVSYHPKVDHLMTDMGQGAHVIPIDDCTTESLLAAFEDIRPHVASWSTKLRARSGEHRARLEALFDEVFGPAEPPARTVQAERPA